QLAYVFLEMRAVDSSVSLFRWCETPADFTASMVRWLDLTSASRPHASPVRVLCGGQASEQDRTEDGQSPAHRERLSAHAPPHSSPVRIVNLRREKVDVVFEPPHDRRGV